MVDFHLGEAINKAATSPGYEITSLQKLLEIQILPAILLLFSYDHPAASVHILKGLLFALSVVR